MLEEKLNIKNIIYEIRGKQVMLDSDLAKLYKVETKVFLQAVKRNIKRFPLNFMFQLTKEEFINLRSQIVTSSMKKNYGGRRYNPYVFTEYGVSMLASVLHSDFAIEVNIRIINAFVEMRKYISNNLVEQQYINNLVLEHDTDIKLLKEIFDSFKEKTNNIYFPGQIFDAYSKILDIFKMAKNNLIIIDPYADNSILNMISKLDTQVIVICKEDNKLTDNDINKYNLQYNNLKVIRDNSFHDRYFIIDKKVIYHCGASINNAGNKIFSINKLEDKFVNKSLLELLDKLIC